MRLSTLVLPAALLAAGLAFAAGKATDPEAKKREAVMFTIGGQAKILGDMASGATAHDAAAADAAKAALAAAADQIAVAYAEPGGEDATSEARPEIWTNWNDFLAKAAVLKTAAEAMDTSSAASIGAGMGAMAFQVQTSESITSSRS
jgi:cytochrome c556